MFEQFSSEIRHAYLTHFRQYLDELTSRELVRLPAATPTPHHSEATWKCRSCGVRVSTLNSRHAIEPASISHSSECSWLKRWLAVPEDYRQMYLWAWFQRHPHSKHLLRARMLPLRTRFVITNLTTTTPTP